MWWVLAGLDISFQTVTPTPTPALWHSQSTILHSSAGHICTTFTLAAWPPPLVPSDTVSILFRKPVTEMEHALLCRHRVRSVLEKTVPHSTVSEMNPPQSMSTLVWETVNQPRTFVLQCLVRYSLCWTLKCQAGSPCSSRLWLNCSTLQRRQVRALITMTSLSSSSPSSPRLYSHCLSTVCFCASMLFVPVPFSWPPMVHPDGNLLWILGKGWDCFAFFALNKLFILSFLLRSSLKLLFFLPLWF